MDEKQLKLLLADGVSIVGNARSITEGPQHGEQIDSRVTIRFNWIKLKYPEYTGTRKDIIATNIPQKLSDTNYSILIGKVRDSRFKFYHYPEKLNRSLTSRTGKKPSNGMRIIWLVDFLEVADVHLYGFDWKRTSSLVEVGARKSTAKTEHHDYSKEQQICYELIDKNKWKLYK